MSCSRHKSCLVFHHHSITQTVNTFTNIVRGRVETASIRVIWYQTVTESQTRWLMSDVWGWDHMRLSPGLQSPADVDSYLARPPRGH